MTLTAKMGRGALLLLRRLRSSAPTGAALLGRARGPGHRGGHAASRGLGVAAPGRTPCAAATGPGGARRAEPGALVRSPRSVSSSSPRPCSAGIEIWSAGGGPTRTGARDGRRCRRAPCSRPSAGQGEPDLGIPADPRGAGDHGCPARPLERVGHPSPARHRAHAEAIGSDLGGVPPGAGDDHAGLRLLHRRHGAPAPPLRACSSSRSTPGGSTSRASPPIQWGSGSPSRPAT